MRLYISIMVIAPTDHQIFVSLTQLFSSTMQQYAVLSSSFPYNTTFKNPALNYEILEGFNT